MVLPVWVCSSSPVQAAWALISVLLGLLHLCAQASLLGARRAPWVPGVTCGGSTSPALPALTTSIPPPIFVVVTVVAAVAAVAAVPWLWWLRRLRCRDCGGCGGCGAMAVVAAVP